jgi:phosphoribosylformylglycinamidine cyclo-ligase
MNVNDILTKRATPLGFLDYIACHRIEPFFEELFSGIEKGCELAECSLLGGETAVMPELYEEGYFDLAGFAIGGEYYTADRPKSLTKKGDILYGIPSSGIHSNGLTVARGVLPTTFYEELLTPTRIYTKEVKEIEGHGGGIRLAHITGGGFDNIIRTIPSNLKYILNWKWDIPEIFLEIQDRKRWTDEEMSKEFNMGIGMVFAAMEDDRKHYDGKFIEIGYLDDF